MKYAPDHPLSGANGYVLLSRWLLFNEIGEGRHECHWCGRRVTWRVGYRGNRDGVLIVDHLDSDPMNDTEGNLVPSCWQCNTLRAKTRGAPVVDGEVYITRKNGTRLRGIARRCEQCKSEFVAQPSDVARGRGRFCSLSCARMSPKPNLQHD